MCGRYVLRGATELSERFQANQLRLPVDFPDRFNVAPTAAMPVVRSSDDGRELALLRWGLVPVWAKDAAAGARAINARAETVAEKPTFRGPLRRRRCVVPASGFYEWRRDGGRKQPWFFHGADGEPLGLAGLWDRWVDPATGEALESYAIVTTTPNALVAAVHDRMPAILRRDDEDAWLDPDLDEPELLRSFLGPYPAGLMAAHPVAPAVNRAGAEGEDLMAPLNSA